MMTIMNNNRTPEWATVENLQNLEDRLNELDMKMECLRAQLDSYRKLKQFLLMSRAIVQETLDCSEVLTASPLPGDICKMVKEKVGKSAEALAVAILETSEHAKIDNSIKEIMDKLARLEVNRGKILELINSPDFNQAKIEEMGIEGMINVAIKPTTTAQ